MNVDLNDEEMAMIVTALERQALVTFSDTRSRAWNTLAEKIGRKKIQAYRNAEDCVTPTGLMGKHGDKVIGASVRCAYCKKEV